MSDGFIHLYEVKGRLEGDRLSDELVVTVQASSFSEAERKAEMEFSGVVREKGVNGKVVIHTVVKGIRLNQVYKVKS